MYMDHRPSFRSHGFAKKQGAVSHSSTEAEVIAMDAALRLEGLPALMLWDIVIECMHKAMSEHCDHKAQNDLSVKKKGRSSNVQNDELSSDTRVHGQRN